MTIIKALVNWAAVAGVVMAMLTAAYLAGRLNVQNKWNIEQATTKAIAAANLRQRNVEIDLLKSQQAQTNLVIQKAHDEQIATISGALANTERLRVNAKLCQASATPPRQTDAQSPTSGDAADTRSGLFSEEMDRAIKRLILETEEVAATGRAAQEFIRVNGLGRD